MTKRNFLKTTALAGMGGVLGASGIASCSANSTPYQGIDTFIDESGKYILPELPYAYNALSAVIDEQTLTLHHTKHHAGYVKGLNATLEKINNAVESGDFGMIKHYERDLAFHGAGHFLHTLYWNSMTDKTVKIPDELKNYIDLSFGSVDKFKAYFAAATKSVEGSGWGLLTYQPETDKLVILQAEKHQNQSQWMNIPIMVCDVWEHAYYLKYQNKRGDYVKAFMEIINWETVTKRLMRLVEIYRK